MGLTVVPKTVSQQKDFIEDVILEQLANSDSPVTIANDLTVTGHLFVNGTTYNNGGLSLDTDDVTESSTRKYLLTGTQTIAGAKTFSSAPLFNGADGFGGCSL